MGPFTSLEVILSTAMVGAGGVAVGKLWGSYGKRTIATCDKLTAACKELWETRLDSIENRLSRIEDKVDKLNGR
jgi:hypothetical protein